VLARDGRLLMLTAILLALAALLALAGALTLRASLPEEADLEWAYPWTQDAEPPEQAERLRRIEAAVASMRDSSAVGLLASPASSAELHEAEAAFLASATPFQGERSSPERRVAMAVRDVRQSAEGTAMLAILLSGVAAAAGLLSLLRLGVRGVTFVTCALLALDATVGISALFLFDAHPAWMVLPTLLCVLGFWGLLLGTNLLPDANHRLVTTAEDTLRSLPAPKRRVHVLTRALAGLLLAAVALVASGVSYAMAAPGGLYTAYVGALALGLIGSALPIIAAARVAARP